MLSCTLPRAVANSVLASSRWRAVSLGSMLMSKQSCNRCPRAIKPPAAGTGWPGRGLPDAAGQCYSFDPDFSTPIEADSNSAVASEKCILHFVYFFTSRYDKRLFFPFLSCAVAGVFPAFVILRAPYIFQALCKRCQTHACGKTRSCETQR